MLQYVCNVLNIIQKNLENARKFIYCI